jgi:aquaporin Z
MQRYITEFIGTFFLVLVVAMTGNAAAIGVTLMVMIFAGGHISGAHYNPAVTLAVLLRKKISSGDAIIYMVVQVIAAIVAALIARWYSGSKEVFTMDLTDKVAPALVGELIGTFALAYVVLNVATSRGTTGNSFYGLAIGSTVFAMAITFGNISGGAFNPAVAVGATVVKAFALKNIWIYLVGCFGGALVAALVFNYINEDDKPVPPLPKT